MHQPTNGPTDRLTDGSTDGPTDGPMDYMAQNGTEYEVTVHRGWKLYKTDAEG